MCGRFSLGLSQEEIRQNIENNYPDVQLGEWINQDAFYPRHNIAPRSQSPVIRRPNPFSQPDNSTSDNAEGPSSGSGGEEQRTTVLQTMKWGLVPHWSKHEDKTLSTTNARSENLVEGGGMWGSIKGRKRCAIVCEGYYEWLKKGKDRLPHFTKHRNNNKLMLLAGLYDVAHLEGEKDPLWTFTIVTTDANKEFSWLHDRQPVILSTQSALDTWLDTSSQAWSAELSKLVKPYHDSKSPLECYQVPKEVGKVGTESITFIQPISERKDGIQAMFAKQTNKSASTSSPVKKPQPETKPDSSSSKTDVKLKRKRSESPSLETKGPSGSKTRKVEETEKRTTRATRATGGKHETEDHPAPPSSDPVEIIEITSTPSKTRSPTKKTNKTATTPKTKGKSKATGQATPGITSFFSKVT